VKSFLLSIASVVLLSLYVASGATAGFAAQRPNILFIMPDDHAYQAISAYGSNRNQTPNIDQIAAEGMRFDRCYVTNSICSPSRATILTGQYSHKNGVPDNYTEFDGSQVTFPKLLQAAGYQTALIGKWHLHSEPTGFDHWDILPGHGKYYRPEFITSEGKTEFPGYVTDITTDKAIDWLRKGRDREKPFLLMVHHKAPHARWDPAAEKLSLFEDVTIPEPATLFDDYKTRGTAARHARMRLTHMNPESDLKLWGKEGRTRTWLYGHMTPEERSAWKQHVDPRLARFKQANPQGKEKTRWYYQLYIKDYLRCIASIDEGVGQLLAALEETGLADNTIVVYTSDQGFYLGEHGWFDKRFMYEESLRTPLVVRWPGVIESGRVEERIVSNVDFAETFLDAACVDVPDEMQGRSFLPLLRGETSDDWRDSFYYQYLAGVERDHRVYKHEGVTTGSSKLISYYPLQEWELFDLENDPHEVNNVYGQPEFSDVQAKLTGELQRLRQALEVPPND